MKLTEGVLKSFAEKNSIHKSKLNKINEILEKEKRLTMSYENLGYRIENTKEILKCLKNIKNDIIGYGASTKGNTLNHCSIGSKDLAYICDANLISLRVYLGSNIKIISKEK